jgi:hypothetical protein
MITLSATPNQLREDAAAAVAHLARSERGRRVLSAVADAGMDISGLDAANSEALRDVVEVFSSGQVNGSVLDLLRPFKSKPSA